MTVPQDDIPPRFPPIPIPPAVPARGRGRLAPGAAPSTVPARGDAGAAQGAAATAGKRGSRVARRAPAPTIPVRRPRNALGPFVPETNP